MCECLGGKPGRGEKSSKCPTPAQCFKHAGSRTGSALFLLNGASQEHPCRDPKDGELCLCRAKSGETLMEARSDTDVQIVRLT